MDWLKAIDIERALANVHNDIIGDWYYDPWGWSELAKSQRLADAVVQRLNSRGVRDTAPIDVAKQNFGTRPAVVMDPIDRLCYQALVDTLSKRVIGSMSPNAYGWRLDPKDPQPGVYVRDDHQWENYLGHITSLAGDYKAALTTDIVSFFGAVPIGALVDQLRAFQPTNAVVERVTDMLYSWNQQLLRKGLPQRCRASSVLANMYVRPIDDLLTSLCKGRSGMSWTRWMDDIWIFGNKPGQLRRAQTEINERMRELSLQLNDSKTELLEGEAVKKATERLQKRGIEYLLKTNPSDSGPLEEVIEEEILNDPTEAERTVIRYATHRIRKHKFYSLVDTFDTDVIERAPQGADHFARLFRDSEHWTSLEMWYTKYCRSDWSCIDWAMGSLCRMFPSHETPKHVSDFVATYLEKNTAPPLAVGAVFAQRLASWNADQAKEVLRVAAKDSKSAQSRRWIALTGLNAGLDRGWVKNVLSEFEENAATLSFLEAQDFRPVKVVADFSGD